MMPFEQSARVLAKRYPELRAIIKRIGPPALPRRHASAFTALAHSIVGQQLATGAADAIWKRTRALCPRAFSPAAVLALEPENMRGAGLSRAKLRAITDLASKAHSGEISLRALTNAADDVVIERLCTVHGIGPWSAQMFLIFHLYREDVWPTGDLGVRRGYGRLFGCEQPSAKELEPLGDVFRDHRSTVAWYCWRA